MCHSTPPTTADEFGFERTLPDDGGEIAEAAAQARANAAYTLGLLEGHQQGLIQASVALHDQADDLRSLPDTGPGNPSQQRLSANGFERAARFIGGLARKSEQLLRDGHGKSIHTKAAWRLSAAFDAKEWKTGEEHRELRQAMWCLG